LEEGHAKAAAPAAVQSLGEHHATAEAAAAVPALEEGHGKAAASSAVQAEEEALAKAAAPAVVQSLEACQAKAAASAAVQAEEEALAKAAAPAAVPAFEEGHAKAAAPAAVQSLGEHHATAEAAAVMPYLEDCHEKAAESARDGTVLVQSGQNIIDSAGGNGLKEAMPVTAASCVVGAPSSERGALDLSGDAAGSLAAAAHQSTTEVVEVWSAQGCAAPAASRVPARSADDSEASGYQHRSTAGASDLSLGAVNSSQHTAMNDTLRDLSSQASDIKATGETPLSPICTALENALKTGLDGSGDWSVRPRVMLKPRVTFSRNGMRCHEAMPDDDVGRFCGIMDDKEGGVGEGPASDRTTDHSFVDDKVGPSRTVADTAETRAVAPMSFGALGPDPMLVWKASVLRTLRGANDCAMTVTALAALVPNMTPGTSYAEQLQTHLVDRLLAKWVIENESLQLCCP
jgi:hypothetical protein